MNKHAVISDCGLYRYWLSRTWDEELSSVCWIMLNPSTADASVDDPTIRRVVNFSKAWGCGEAVVVNLFAFRATNPRDMINADDPVGPENDDAIREAIEGRKVVLAWGACPQASWRSKDVLRLLRRHGVVPECLGTTSGGMPKHPLYVKGDTLLIPYQQVLHR